MKNALYSVHSGDDHNRLPRKYARKYAERGLAKKIAAFDEPRGVSGLEAAAAAASSSKRYCGHHPLRRLQSLLGLPKALELVTYPSSV